MREEQRIKELEKQVDILEKRIITLCNHKVRQKYKTIILPFGGPMFHSEECSGCGSSNIMDYHSWKKKKNTQEKKDDIEKAEAILFKHGMKIQ